MAVADGILVYLNCYTCSYTPWQGPSTTQSQLLRSSNTITIQGTVTDQSSGAKQLVQTGQMSIVPAASDADMGAWMEYLYMQSYANQRNSIPVTIYISDQNHKIVATET